MRMRSSGEPSQQIFCHYCISEVMHPVSNSKKGRFIRVPWCKALWEKGTQVNTTSRIPGLENFTFLWKRTIAFKTYFDLFTDGLSSLGSL